ncbi:hypothetical protein L3V81_10160 [Thiotrichales bacterium 19S3-11]|nr:hypothetical protein [Thiotrichales bacterium 19S3-11]
MIESIGMEHTKNIIEYLKLNETDRVSVPSKYDDKSVLSKIIPEEVLKILINDFGGERLRPVDYVESDLIKLRSKMVKALSKEFTEEEIAFCFGLKPRTIRYMYKVRTDDSYIASGVDNAFKQQDLFE